MGDIYLELIVSNLSDPGRQKEVSFLVDTGATRARLPEEIAAELAIQAVGTLPLELADGSVKDYPYGYCFFTFGEETVAGNVIIGPAGIEPLVGTHVLQDFRLIIDLERHTVSRSRALRAK
ncbi:MAG: aspartyl protease family protein [Desulfobaccales bacterium]